MIRKIYPFDCSVITNLENEFFNTAFKQKQLINLINQPSFIGIVAAESGNNLNKVVAGYLMAHHVATEGEIISLAVLPEVRRRGVGTRLLKNFLRIAKSQGAEKVILDVATDNEGARCFYKKNNFCEVGTRLNYYRNSKTGGDAITMACELSTAFS